MVNHEKMSRDFSNYDFKEVVVDTVHVPLYLDCYQEFGWVQNEVAPISTCIAGKTKLMLKRSRTILNKMELTRLERNFESCAEEIQELQRSAGRSAAVISISTAAIGIALLIGSIMAITATPQQIIIAIRLVIPAIVCIVSAFPLFGYFKLKRSKVTQPLIELKYREVHNICKKGASLLT